MRYQRMYCEEAYLEPSQRYLMECFCLNSNKKILYLLHAALEELLITWKYILKQKTYF